MKGKTILKKLASLIFGGLLGILFIYFLKDFILEAESLELAMIGIFAIFFSSLFLQIIVHELGHLIFGLLTGYSFVSFRIANLMLIKDGDSYGLKQLHVPGTAGQCLLEAPGNMTSDYPFVLYNLGGGLLNIVLSTLLLISLIFFDLSLTLESFFKALIIFGYVFALLNLIPMKSGEISNDGYNLMILLKNKPTRRYFWLQLKINAYMTRGSSYGDIEEKYFILDEDIKLEDPISMALRIMRTEYYRDRDMLEEYKEEVEDILKIDSILSFHSLYLKLNYSLFRAVKGDWDYLDENWMELEKIVLPSLSNSIESSLLYYSYYSICNYDEGKRNLALKKYEKNLKKHPYQAEKETMESYKKIIDSRFELGLEDPSL